MEAGQIKAKLEKELLEATWAALKDHHTRGALILVSPQLLLTDVGTAVAIDDATLVGGWMERGEIFKPAASLIESWEQGKLFRMIIVQPFVLIQELTEEEEEALKAKAKDSIPNNSV